MLPPKVYEAPDRTCVWALDKLGMKEEQWPQMHTQEALSDSHQIVHCKVIFGSMLMTSYLTYCRSAENAS